MKSIFSRVLIVSIALGHFACNSDDDSGILPAQDVGLSTVVLGNTISNTEAANIIATDVGATTTKIIVQNTKVLTTLDLSAVNELVDLEVVNNEKLQNINLSSLSKVSRSLRFDNNAALTEIVATNLVEVGDIEIGDSPQLNIISCDKLQRANGFNIRSCSLINSLSFPALEQIYNRLYFQDLESLEALNLNNIKEAGDLFITSNPKLRDLALPGIGASVSYLLLRDLPELPNIDIATLPESDHLGFDNIASLTSFKSSTLGANSILTFRNNPNLETVDLTGVENFSNLTFQLNGKLRTILTPNLKKAGRISIIGENALEEVNFPSLVEMSSFTLQLNDLIKVLQLPEVTYMTGLSLGGNALLETIDFPKLQKVPARLPNNVVWFRVFNCPVLKTINLPEVTSLAFFVSFTDLEGLEEVNIPKLIEIGRSFEIRAAGNLKRLNLPNLERVDLFRFSVSLVIEEFNASSLRVFDDFKGPSLNATDGEAFLSSLVSKNPPIQGKRIRFGISGSSSTQVLSDIETLELQGNQVDIRL